MRKLLSEYFTTTYIWDDRYYTRKDPRDDESGPSVVLIVGLTMAFVGAAILIIVICCVCRKRQPPDSQGAVYQRTATSEATNAGTSYPLGPVSAAYQPVQPSSNTTKTTSTPVQMSSMGGQPVPYLPPSGHSVHYNYPGYPSSGVNMAPPHMYPGQTSYQPMTTLAIFGAPDGRAAETTPMNVGPSLPYTLNPMGPGDGRSPENQTTEFGRQQATAPPPPPHI